MTATIDRQDAETALRDFCALLVRDQQALDAPVEPEPAGWR